MREFGKQCGNSGNSAGILPEKVPAKFPHCFPNSRTVSRRKPSVFAIGASGFVNGVAIGPRAILPATYGQLPVSTVEMKIQANAAKAMKEQQVREPFAAGASKPGLAAFWGRPFAAGAGPGPGDGFYRFAGVRDRPLDDSCRVMTLQCTVSSGRCVISRRGGFFSVLRQSASGGFP